MAYAVLAAVERRVGDGRAVLGGHYLRPWEDGTVVQVTVHERPPLVSYTDDSLRADPQRVVMHSEVGVAGGPNLSSPAR
jgi:hypothetical protein